jgi:hypothetical protein
MKKLNIGGVMEIGNQNNPGGSYPGSQSNQLTSNNQEQSGFFDHVAGNYPQVSQNGYQQSANSEIAQNYSSPTTQANGNPLFGFLKKYGLVLLVAVLVVIIGYSFFSSRSNSGQNSLTTTNRNVNANTNAAAATATNTNTSSVHSSTTNNNLNSSSGSFSTTINSNKTGSVADMINWRVIESRATLMKQTKVAIGATQNIPISVTYLGYILGEYAFTIENTKDPSCTEELFSLPKEDIYTCGTYRYLFEVLTGSNDDNAQIRVSQEDLTLPPKTSINSNTNISTPANQNSNTNSYSNVGESFY